MGLHHAPPRRGQCGAKEEAKEEAKEAKEEANEEAKEAKEEAKGEARGAEEEAKEEAREAEEEAKETKGDALKRPRKPRKLSNILGRGPGRSQGRSHRS